MNDRLEDAVPPDDLVVVLVAALIDQGLVLTAREGSTITASVGETMSPREGARLFTCRVWPGERIVSSPEPAGVAVAFFDAVGSDMGYAIAVDAMLATWPATSPIS